MILSQEPTSNARFLIAASLPCQPARSLTASAREHTPPIAQDHPTLDTPQRKCWAPAPYSRAERAAPDMMSPPSHYKTSGSPHQRSSHKRCLDRSRRSPPSSGAVHNISGMKRPAPLRSRCRSASCLARPRCDPGSIYLYRQRRSTSMCRSWLARSALLGGRRVVHCKCPNFRDFFALYFTCPLGGDVVYDGASIASVTLERLCCQRRAVIITKDDHLLLRELGCADII